MDADSKEDNDCDNDKAGVAHWDETYTGWSVGIFDPHPKGIRYSGRKKWHALFAKVFSTLALRKGTLIEVGCGGSKYLPYFGNEFNLAVSGIDYSVNGCALAEKNLAWANVKGDIYYGDIFSPPNQLKGSFDIAVSFGLVEHFSDTENPIAHITNLLKPGGLIITTVPNMAGIAGLAQKLICRSVYDAHIALTKDGLMAAHVKSGLMIIETGYLEFINFGVVNVGAGSAGLQRTLKILLHKALLAITLLTWALEKMFGPFAGNSVTSPYIYCIARKPAQSDGN